jgi:ATP-dependent helicase/nuclease subunit A
VQPGDITLLFRALTNVELYEEALRRYDIEYYLVGGHAFYAQQEIYDVVNLLRTLASPGDEASLAGVLRSPMFGLLDETLFQLVQRHGSLSAGLFAKDRPKSFRTPEGDSPIFAGRKLGQSPGSSPADPNQGPAPEADGEPIDEEQSARVRFAAATIAELRAIKDRVPIAELLGAALARTGYDAVLLAEFLGPRKLANLQKLVEQARSFDASGIFTLADFITQLAQFIARQPDEPLAATQPESIHAVRLMTIHQAKGLEFPVVIVADLDRPRRKVGPAAAFTPRLGPVVRLPEVTSGYDLFMAAEAEEESAELKRLLYVATTRAADYLILSAGLAAGGTPRGPWMELLARRFDLQSGAMIPVGGAAAPSPPALLAAEERRLATVATSEPPLGTVPKAKASRPDLSKLVAEAREAAARHLGQVPKELAPVAPDPLARRQYSFSRLSGVLHARGGPLVTAATDDDAEPAAALDPLGLGTLVHAVLAELAERGQTAPGKGTVPFSSDENRDSPPAASADDIAALVRRHAARHLPDVGGSAPSPSEETGNPQVAPDGLEEPIDLVRRLLASKRWSAVAGAAEVYTELEFLLPWPPGNADPRAPYLRGYIDCLYRDTAGDWHLLDYKTNRVAADGVAVVAAEYEMQMLVYALAVERILGAGPRELVLCFLRPGVEFLFAWDAAARARAIELVNQAIRRAMSN